MNLPKSWNEITVSQYVELQTIDLAEFDSVFLQSIEVLSILTNEPPEEFEELDPEELIDLMNQVSFIQRDPPNKPKELINGLKIAPFIGISLGEFIDLEHYTTNIAENFTTILAILYKRWKTDEWGNVQFEPYTYNLNGRTNVFEDLPISEVFGAVNNYIEFANNFKQRYENLFNPHIEDEPTEMDEDDLKAEAEEKVFNKWSWEKLLFDLANEDITKINSVTELSLVFVFNMLSMVEELNLNK